MSDVNEWGQVVYRAIGDLYREHRDPPPDAVDVLVAVDWALRSQPERVRLAIPARARTHVVMGLTRDWLERAFAAEVGHNAAVRAHLSGPPAEQPN